MFFVLHKKWRPGAVCCGVFVPLLRRMTRVMAAAAVDEECLLIVHHARVTPTYLVRWVLGAPGTLVHTEPCISGGTMAAIARYRRRRAHCACAGASRAAHALWMHNNVDIVFKFKLFYENAAKCQILTVGYLLYSLVLHAPPARQAHSWGSCLWAPHICTVCFHDIL